MPNDLKNQAMRLSRNHTESSIFTATIWTLSGIVLAACGGGGSSGFVTSSLQPPVNPGNRNPDLPVGVQSVDQPSDRQSDDQATGQSSHVSGDMAATLGQGRTGYTLTRADMAANDEPVDTPGPVYTITDLPDSGTLARNSFTGSNTLAVGHTFTQRNIDDGQILYSFTGTAPTSADATDSFSFSIANEQGTSISASETISLTIPVPSPQTAEIPFRPDFVIAGVGFEVVHEDIEVNRILIRFGINDDHTNTDVMGMGLRQNADGTNFSGFLKFATGGNNLPSGGYKMSQQQFVDYWNENEIDAPAPTTNPASLLGMTMSSYIRAAIITPYATGEHYDTSGNLVNSGANAGDNKEGGKWDGILEEIGMSTTPFKTRWIHKNSHGPIETDDNVVDFTTPAFYNFQFDALGINAGLLRGVLLDATGDTTDTDTATYTVLEGGGIVFNRSSVEISGGMFIDTDGTTQSFEGGRTGYYSVSSGFDLHVIIAPDENGEFGIEFRRDNAYLQAERAGDSYYLGHFNGNVANRSDFTPNKAIVATVTQGADPYSDLPPDPLPIDNPPPDL